MNVFNRILIALLCLSLIAAAISIVALAWSIPAESIDGLREAVDWLEENNQDLEKGFLSAGATLLVLLALVVLVLELLPSRGTDVRVTDLNVGNAVLSTASIGQRIEEAVNNVPHVSDARVVVKAKRKGVTVAMDLHVDPEANLAAVTDDACMAARDVLTNRVHVALAEPPRARVFYREIRLRRPVAPRPAAATPAQPAATNGAAQPAQAVMATAEPVAVAVQAPPESDSELAPDTATPEETPAEERRPEQQ